MFSFSITLLLIIVTVAVSVLAFSNAQIFQQALMNPFMIFQKKQYWRLLASGFIHSSYIHLGFNMFTFFFFGRVVELVFGELFGESGIWLYVVFYLSAIVVSDLPTAWKNRTNVGYNSLGASGAVSAMVFASIIYFPLNDICLYGLLCIPGFILGILYVIYSYYQGKNQGDHINHSAHLYGALYGALFAIAVYPGAVPAFIDQVSGYRPF